MSKQKCFSHIKLKPKFKLHLYFYMWTVMNNNNVKWVTCCDESTESHRSPLQSLSAQCSGSFSQLWSAPFPAADGSCFQQRQEKKNSVLFQFSTKWQTDTISNCEGNIVKYWLLRVGYFPQVKSKNRAYRERDVRTSLNTCLCGFV